MKALIKNNNIFYTTYVLAISNDKRYFDKKIIIFNENYNSLKMIDIYRKEKCESGLGHSLYLEAFIFDCDETEYIVKNNWTGFASVVENNKIFKMFENVNEIKLSEFENLKYLAKEIVIPKWFDASFEKDLKNLEFVSSGFHDGSLRSAEQTENNLILSFDCMDCIINIQFIDIIEENIIGKVYEIFDSEFKIVDNVYIWNINDAWEGWVDGTDCTSISGLYIKCKKILWNFIVEFD